jgi:hypothetical protein
MPLEPSPQSDQRRALSNSSAASSTAAAWNAFLLRAEARAWISAAEQGRQQPEVGAVALEVLLLEYGRPARLALGLVSSVALVVAATLSVATVTVLGPFWVGESGAFFGFVVLIGFAVALMSVVILLRLQVSENRIIRAISVWSGATSEIGGSPEPQTASASAEDRREAVATRTLFLAVSGAGIAATVFAMVWLSSAEAGAFVLPFLVAAILQLIIWLAVCSGVVRVLRSSRV